MYTIDLVDPALAAALLVRQQYSESTQPAGPKGQELSLTLLQRDLLRQPSQAFALNEVGVQRLAFVEERQPIPKLDQEDKNPDESADSSQ